MTSWRVETGDSFDLMAGLGDGSIDAIVTDPPYASVGAEVSSVKYHAFALPEGQFYEAWFRLLLRELGRVLVPTGAMWATVDWHGALAIERAAHAEGWCRPHVGVWHRAGLGMGSLMRHCYECFVVLSRPGFERRRKDEPDVWVHPWTPAHRTNGHTAEKPVDLMARAIGLVAPAGGVVLDPFCGVGTTGVAALGTGRAFVGFERDADHSGRARERLAAFRPADADRLARLLEGRRREEQMILDFGGAV